MREIVGAMINGGTITNNRDDITLALNSGRVNHWLSRDHMRFMSSCDLGRNWDLMASGPTLFLLDEKNVPHSAIDNRKE